MWEGLTKNGAKNKKIKYGSPSAKVGTRGRVFSILFVNGSV
jgi:hypothetical protein